MATDFFVHRRVHSVELLEFRLPLQLDSADFDRLSEAVLSIVDSEARQKWVIDLSVVDYMGSATLGLMVNIRQRVKQGGGRLVLCGLSARMAGIFHACSLERLFVLCKNRDEAFRMVEAKVS